MRSGRVCVEIRRLGRRLDKRAGYPLQSGAPVFKDAKYSGSLSGLGNEHFALHPRCNMYGLGEELEALNGDTRAYSPFALRKCKQCTVTTCSNI
jgi:hypothetical protein